MSDSNPPPSAAPSALPPGIAFGAPPQGGAAGGPAEPDPRRPLGGIFAAVGRLMGPVRVPAALAPLEGAVGII